MPAMQQQQQPAVQTQVANQVAAGTIHQTTQLPAGFTNTDKPHFVNSNNYPRQHMGMFVAPENV